MLKGAPTFAEVWPQMEAFLKGTAHLLAHNASFDRRVLAASCQATGACEPRTHFFCVRSRLAPQPAPCLKKLSSVCAYFGIDLNHHHAGSDAEACARIYLQLRSLGVTDAQMRL